MDKLLEALKKAKIEVTDDLKKALQTVWDEAINQAKEEGKKSVDTGNLFTQEQLNEIISKRLARQEKIHEAEIKELQEKMKGLLDPSKVKEYEDKVKELEENGKKTQAALKKEYELKLAATKAGIKDPDYFEFLAQKEKLYDRIKVNDDGSLVVTDKDGNVLAEKDGKKFGPEKLIEEIKASKPDLFGEVQQQPRWTPGATNPAGGGSGGGTSIGEQLAKQQKEAAQNAGKGQEVYFGK